MSLTRIVPKAPGRKRTIQGQNSRRELALELANSNKYNFSQYVSPQQCGKWQWRHIIRGAFYKI
jgi:hypothetical protein